MAKKKNTLTEALKKTANPETETEQITVAIEKTKDVKPLNVPPSRKGKKAITGFFNPDVSRQLHQIALDENSSLQELLREAINDLFQKRNKPVIA